MAVGRDKSRGIVTPFTLDNGLCASPCICNRTLDKGNRCPQFPGKLLFCRVHLSRNKYPTPRLRKLRIKSERTTCIALRSQDEILDAQSSQSGDCTRSASVFERPGWVSGLVFYPHVPLKGTQLSKRGISLSRGDNLVRRVNWQEGLVSPHRLNMVEIVCRNLAENLWIDYCIE